MAQTMASAAVRGRVRTPQPPPHGQVIYLASTFVQQGEICSAGGLLNELTDAWTPGLARRVVTFRQLLEPFGTARWVRDFDEQFPLPVSRRDGGVG
jgi:hypothetical protein